MNKSMIAGMSEAAKYRGVPVDEEILIGFYFDGKGIRFKGISSEFVSTTKADDELGGEVGDKRMNDMTARMSESTKYRGVPLETKGVWESKLYIRRKNGSWEPCGEAERSKLFKTVGVGGAKWPGKPLTPATKSRKSGGDV